MLERKTREAAVARGEQFGKKTGEGGELAALFSISTSTVTVAATSVLVHHWRMQFPWQPFTALKLAGEAEKGGAEDVIWKVQKTYGVGGGKLWQYGEKETRRNYSYTSRWR